MSKSKVRPVSKQQYKRLVMVFFAAIAICSVLLAGMTIPMVGLLGVTARAGTKTFDDMPSEFEVLPPSQRSTILAADGSEIARFFAENRIVVPLDKMSPWIQKAAVAIEDRRYWEHRGVDAQGVFRALINNAIGGDTEGASTLTQQFVKNTLIETGLQKNDPILVAKAKEHSISRKLREAKYAVALEKKIGKKKVLEGYLNIAPFGPNVYGTEAAARLYFSKSGKDLTISEAALLAGLTQNPVEHDPLLHPDRAESRRNQVLVAMLDTKAITPAQFEDAKKQKVQDILHPSAAQQGCSAAGISAYFCAYVLHEIYTNPAFGKDLVTRRNLLMRGGLTIKTTMNPTAQQAATKTVFDSIPATDPSGAKVAIASIEPGTGKILALAQNTNFGNPTANDKTATEQSFAVDEVHGGGAGHQTGSSFKPVTLATWYKSGHSPYAVVGGRTHYSEGDWNVGNCKNARPGVWDVHNNDHYSPAPTNIIRGTQMSLNTTYAGMAARMPLCDILKTSEDLRAVPGDSSTPPFVPSDILGSRSVPPLNMANMYATFANKGVYCSPIAITSVVNSQGKAIKVPPSKCEKVMEAGPAALTINTLEKTYNSYGYVNIGRPAATKTGTTSNATDAWLVGTVPQMATAVWVGHSEGNVPMLDTEINGNIYHVVYGSTIPAQTFARYMRAALTNVPIRGFDYSQMPAFTPPKPATPKKADKKKEEKPHEPEKNDEEEDE
ncbi:MAG: transglycosylase domain-containing protein [Actinomycetaceae bacterium]|nr:transglycosylase domain-containing protein [Actinomycetaceae bacterium]